MATNGERDPKFYSELKQLNQDLVEYLRQSQDKSPFFDFTPTLKDYIKQMEELEQQYGKTKAAQQAPPPTKPTFSAPSVPFLFGSSSIPTSSLNSLTSPSNNATSTNLNLGNTSSSLAAPATLASLGSLSSTSTTPFFSFTMPPSVPTPAPTIQPLILTKSNDDGDKEGTGAGNDDEDDAPPPEPKLDKYEEPDAKYSIKCKLYEKSKSVSGEISLLGIGILYVKGLETPNKLQVIVRQEPDLRRVLVNEVITSHIPVKLLPKAVQVIFPDSKGGTRFYIVKVKEDSDASTLYEMLNLAKS